MDYRHEELGVVQAKFLSPETGCLSRRQQTRQDYMETGENKVSKISKRLEHMRTLDPLLRVSIIGCFWFLFFKVAF